MIAGQLATCEECRDGKCAACKRFKARRRRMKRAGFKDVKLAPAAEGDMLGFPRPA